MGQLLLLSQFRTCLIDNCKAKASDILTNHIRWIGIQEVIFFHAAIVLFEGQSVLLRNYDFQS